MPQNPFFPKRAQYTELYALAREGYPSGGDINNIGSNFKHFHILVIIGLHLLPENHFWSPKYPKYRCDTPVSIKKIFRHLLKKKTYVTLFHHPNV